jgi:predicted GNAT family N-acyltransferase
MRLQVIRNLTDHLKNAEKTTAFLDMLELRQRLFREHKEKLLVLDSYDLISDHVLLYSGRDDRLIGYVRAISASKCAEYEVPFPMFALLGDRSEYHEGIKRFRERSGNPLHMGYLCLDLKYREELCGMKFIDLMVWAAMELSEIPRTELGFTATLNNIYKQDGAMRLLGDWIEDQPDYHHPVVDALHRVLLIPRITPEYWDRQFVKFKAAYGALGAGGRDLLRDESKIAA